MLRRAPFWVGFVCPLLLLALGPLILARLGIAGNRFAADQDAPGERVAELDTRSPEAILAKKFQNRFAAIRAIKDNWTAMVQCDSQLQDILVAGDPNFTARSKMRLCSTTAAAGAGRIILTPDSPGVSAVRSEAIGVQSSYARMMQTAAAAPEESWAPIFRSYDADRFRTLRTDLDSVEGPLDRIRRWIRANRPKDLE